LLISVILHKLVQRNDMDGLVQQLAYNFHTFPGATHLTITPSSHAGSCRRTDIMTRVFLYSIGGQACLYQAAANASSAMARPTRQDGLAYLEASRRANRP
jgi:hypothetical protein